MTASVRTPLLLALLATAALAGIPALLGDDGSPGSIRGVVVDGRGYGVEDAALYLFSEEHLQLVEETRSDDEGSFAFQLSPPRPRVLVRPRADAVLVPAWSAPGDERNGRVAFVLQRARTLDVTVEDENGNELERAEVRVYDRRDDASVVALAETDAEGRARLAAPGEVDVAVFHPGTRLAQWRYEVHVPAEGASLVFRLPRSRVLSGVVSDEGGPMPGIVLVAREEGNLEGFSGFTVSDAHGRYQLPVTAFATIVRAVDRGLAHIPARAVVAPGEDQELDFALQRGNPLVVRTTHAGLPLASRVWSWSPEVESWSWGGRVDTLGRVTIAVSPRFAVHAEPLDPSYPALEAWDVPFEGGTLLLEAEPGG